MFSFSAALRAERRAGAVRVLAAVAARNLRRVKCVRTEGVSRRVKTLRGEFLPSVPERELLGSRKRMEKNKVAGTPWGNVPATSSTLTTKGVFPVRGRVTRERLLGV